MENTRTAVFVFVVLVAGVAAAVIIGTALSHSSGGQTTSGGIATYTYPTSNFNSSISARVGETFIVQLSSNAGSTGYDWSVATSAGIKYLNYTVVSTSTLIGGPQVRNYFFKAVQAGSQTMTLQDKRPFAPYDVAATINLQVAVE